MASDQEIKEIILRIRTLGDPTGKPLNKLRKDTKLMKKLINDTFGKGTEASKKFEKELNELNKQWATNNDSVKAQEKAQKNANKTIDDAIGLRQKQKIELAALREQYDLLTEEEIAAGENIKLIKKMSKLNKSLAQGEEAFGDYRRSVGNYGRVAERLLPILGTMSGNLIAIKNGLKGARTGWRLMSKSAKVFLATIGPLVLIIGLAVKILSKFQGVTDKVDQALSGVDAAVTVVVERIGRLFLAFKKLASFDFKGFAEDATEAFSGMGEQIVKTAKDAAQFTADEQALTEKQIANATKRAQLEVDIAKARREAEEQYGQAQLKRGRASQDLLKQAVANQELAIAKTKDLFKIEREELAERERIQRKRVEQSNETTTREERLELAKLQAQLIKLTAEEEDAIRGLTRKLNTLSKIERQRISAVDQLNQRLDMLGKKLKGQILAQEDYTQTAQEYKKVQKEINALNKEFEEAIQEITQLFQDGSVKDYNDRLSKLKDAMDKLTIGTKEYAEAERELLLLTAERDAATGKLAEQSEKLLDVQRKQVAVLADLETQVRLRAEAQKQIEESDKKLNDGTVQGAKKAAKARKEIEKQLVKDLQQVQKNSLGDKLDQLDSELAAIDAKAQTELALFAGNEEKKKQILAQAEKERNDIRKQQLEIEKQLNKFASDNYKENQQEETQGLIDEDEKRRARRERTREFVTNVAQEGVALLSQIQENATQKALEEIDTREQKELAAAESQGKSEEELQKIREKFQAERAAAEKKAANERKAIALVEAGINIASAIIEALPNIPLVTSIGVLGALQLATIAAAQFADGGLVEAHLQSYLNKGYSRLTPTVQPVQLSSGKVVAIPNIPTEPNGDNIVATIRAGETVINERQRDRLGGVAAMRAAGVPGYANGGIVGRPTYTPTYTYTVPTFSQTATKIAAYNTGGLVGATGGFASNSTNNQTVSFDKQSLSYLANTIAAAVVQGITSSDLSEQVANEQERRAAAQQQSRF